MAAVFAVVRDVLAAASFGASPELDAYLVAVLVPATVFALLVGAANYAYVPLAIRTFQLDGRETYERLVGTFCVAGTIASALVAIATAILADTLARLLLPGASRATIDLGADLLRLLAPAMAGATLAPVFGAVLVAQRVLVPVALGNVIAVSVVVLLLLLAPEPRSVRDYALFTDLGFVAQVGFLLVGVRMVNTPFRVQFTRAIAARLAGALGVGVVGWFAWQFNQIVDRAFASTISDGAVTVSAYSFRTALVFLVLVWPLTTTLIANLPGADREEQQRLTSQAARALLFFAFPVAALLIVLRSPLMSLLLARGRFTLDAAHSASDLLGLYALSLPVVAIALLLTTTLYASNRRREAAVVGVAAVGIEGLCDFVGVRTFGLVGLPLALIAATVIWVAILVALQRDLVSPIFDRATGASIAKYLAGTAALVVAASVFAPWQPAPAGGESLVKAGGAALAGAAAYIATLAALRSPELTTVARLLTSKRVVYR